MSEPELAPQGLPDFLRDPVGIVQRRWRIMTAALLVGLVATAAAVVLVPVLYRASASLLVSGQQIPEDFVRTTVPEDLGDRMSALVAQAVSQERLLQLIEENNLHRELRNTLTMEEIAARVRSEIEVTLDTSLIASRQRPERAVVFRVSFANQSPETAAAVVNQVTGRIVEEALRMRTEQARLTTEFLQRELKSTEIELRELESRISEFKRLYRGELPSELQANLAKLERLQKERDSISLQITESATRVAMLSTAGGTELDTPEARLDALRDQLAKLRTTYTDAHPDVRGVQREIAALEAEVADQPEGSQSAVRVGRPSLVAAEQRMLQELRAQLAATEAEIDDLDQRVTRTPKREEEMEALVQRSGVLRDQYLDFLRKVQEAELAESLEQAQQGERLSVLSWATAPRQPEKSRFTFLLIGLAGSLGFAALAGIGREALDPVLISASQIASATGIPVLGSAARIT